jgi:hypothetical protein
MSLPRQPEACQHLRAYMFLLPHKLYYTEKTALCPFTAGATKDGIPLADCITRSDGKMTITSVPRRTVDFKRNSPPYSTNPLTIGSPRPVPLRVFLRERPAAERRQDDRDFFGGNAGPCVGDGEV